MGTVPASLLGDRASEAAQVSAWDRFLMSLPHLQARKTLKKKKKSKQANKRKTQELKIQCHLTIDLEGAFVRLHC